MNFNYMPHDAYGVRAAYVALGVPLMDVPEAVAQLLQVVPPVPLRASIHYRLAARIREFEHEDEYMLMRMLYELHFILRPYTSPKFIDVRDPDALLAEAVHRYGRVSRQGADMARNIELARWIDFLPDAYEAREQNHAAWLAKCAVRRNAALKGAATRRMRREAQAHA